MPRPATKPRRFLLDENVDEDLTGILESLGHTAAHIKSLGLGGTSDEDLVEVARDYDIFVTLDLHRQEAEWVAVNSAIAEGNICVLRIRLPQQGSDVRLDTTRSLIYRMDKWLHEFDQGKTLVTIRELGTVVSARSPAEVAKMLEGRQPKA